MKIDGCVEKGHRIYKDINLFDYCGKPVIKLFFRLEIALLSVRNQRKYTVNAFVARKQELNKKAFQ